MPARWLAAGQGLVRRPALRQDAGVRTRGTSLTLSPTRLLASSVAAVLALALPTGLLVAPAEASDVASPTNGVITFDGRGFGHGRGMSQYGAYGAALQGLDHAQILAFYYSGTVLGTAPGAQRRVLLTGQHAGAVVSNAPGLVLRDTASGAVVHAGARGDWSRVQARPDGSVLRVEALQGGAWVPILPPVSGPVVFSGPAVLSLHHSAGLRGYRGTLTAALSGTPDKPLYVVSTVGLDDYVRGVVPAEMPTSWPAQALRAQAVAARSYGLQPCRQSTPYPAIAHYDVVDTTACQVYGGTNAETAASNDAVDRTAGQVLRYDGVVLRAEFSSSNGGWTVANGGAFVAKQDPYDAVGAQAGRSTVHRWTGVQVPAAKLEQAFGTGTLRQLQVLSRDGRGEWGGRVLRVRLVGDSRTVEVTGDQVRSAAGLRSSWFDLWSPIDSKHASLGGDGGLLGPAVAPEVVLPSGRFRHYRSGSIYWSPAAGAFAVLGAIRDDWAKLGWEAGTLGYPLTDELGTPDGIGRYQVFQRGAVYWSSASGAWSVQGAIQSAWGRLGYERGRLGYPTTDELGTPEGTGRFNHFQRGSIYWSPQSGAHEVSGAIRDRWASMRWETGVLAYPLTDELATSDRVGRFNHFQGGSVYWSPRTGAHEVLGPLREAWAAAGWESGLGYPVTGQLSTPDGTGRYNHFESGSVYWTSATGAHEVHGAIRTRWVELGSQAGPLGYPVSSEYAVPGGRRNDFQRGSLTWNASTGQVSTTLG